MKQSAGFLIKSRGLFLLCHATQLVADKQKYDGKWTISKGRCDEGETLLQTAIRELKEETGLDILSYYNLNHLIYPSNTYIASNRKVSVFFFDDYLGLLLKQPLVCNSIIQGHHISRYNGRPEMDGFDWVPAEEALNMVFPSQKHLFLGGF